MEDFVISARGLRKTFPGVVALDDVSFDLRRGEIHALLGENGAGKSTFVKILTGAYKRTAGDIVIEGASVDFDSTAEAHDRGIRIVFQELSQINSLTVAENIYLGEWPTTGGVVDWAQMNRDADRLLKMFDVRAEPGERLGDLGIATRQMVEIVKGCRKSHTKVLVLDEPTSALSEVETETLFKFLRNVRAEGVAIIYISHRLAEIRRLCDRITVFRNGKNVGTVEVESTNIHDVIAMMVGRSMSDRFPPKAANLGDQGLRVEALTTEKLKGVSFEARRGEVVGIAGLIGAGKTELLRAIYGADPRSAGVILLDGRQVLARHPKAAVAAGFGLLPENRKDEGFVGTGNNIFNVTIASLARFASPFLSLSRERSAVVDTIERMDLRPKDPDALTINLSGGNQQKIVLSRWLLASSTVLLFDEPTRGVDVGAKYQIYQQIAAMADQNKCVIVSSSDTDELVGICNKIIVLSSGKMVAELTGAEITEERVLHLSLGGSGDRS